MNIKHASFILLLLSVWLLPLAQVQADASKAEQYYQEGKQALIWGQTGKAEIKLLLAKREAPERTDIVEQLIMVYLVQQQYDKGLKQADELLKANKNDPQAHLLKGKLLQHQGDLQAAQASYISAAGLAPEDAKVLAEVGGFFLFIGETVQAESYSQRVKALQNK